MKQRILQFLLTLILLFAGMQASGEVIEVAVGDFRYRLDPNNRTAEVLAGHNEGSLAIPSSIGQFWHNKEWHAESYEVTGIADFGFTNCPNLREIFIPETIKTIGDNAFNSLMLLDYVKTSEGLKSIGVGAFVNCPKLKSIKLPESLTKIEAGAFNSSGLTSITLPKRITTVEQGVFANCSKLTTVILPENLTLIQSRAFQSCAKLPTIKLPEKLTKIDTKAFAGCSGLQTIYSYNPIPPTIAEDTFDESTTKTATLIVPAGSVESYKEAPYWKNFYNIRADVSGIDDILYDATDQNGNIEVFNLAGVRVYTGPSAEAHLPAGIYIARQGNKTTKIVVK